MKSVYSTPSVQINAFVEEDIMIMSGGEFTTEGIYLDDEWSGFGSD